MKWKTLLCGGLAAALLAGCAGQPPEPTPVSTPEPAPLSDDIAYQAAGIPRDTVLFTAGGAEVTADDYLYWLFSAIAVAKNSGYLADDAAWEEKIGDTPTAEYLKESALENSKLYAVALAKAEEEDVALTQEDQDTIETELESLTAMLEAYYGISFQEYLDQQCISEAAYRRMAYEIPLLVGDLQEKYTQAGEFDPTDEIMADMIQREDIHSCKHILLAFPKNEDGSDATDEQKAAVKAEAEALLADLQAAADPAAAFEQAMNERSEDGRDPETNELYKPEGYTFLGSGVLVDGSSSLVAPFVQAGVALSEGELSQPVETDYGYHILLGQSADNEETRALYPNYAMNRRIDQWMAEAVVETTDAYEDLDPKAFYDGMMELARQWQEEAQAEASSTEDDDLSEAETSTPTPVPTQDRAESIFDEEPMFDHPSYNENDGEEAEIDYGTDDGGKRASDAWVCAIDIVESSLKAPGTAKFCAYSDATITWLGGSRYKVKGYVDAENSYGAMLRSDFIVELTLTDSGYKDGYVTFD